MTKNNNIQLLIHTLNVFTNYKVQQLAFLTILLEHFTYVIVQLFIIRVKDPELDLKKFQQLQLSCQQLVKVRFKLNPSQQLNLIVKLYVQNFEYFMYKFEFDILNSKVLKAYNILFIFC